jgi:hypothetical protein
MIFKRRCNALRVLFGCGLRIAMQQTGAMSGERERGGVMQRSGGCSVAKWVVERPFGCLTISSGSAGLRAPRLLVADTCRDRGLFGGDRDGSAGETCFSRGDRVFLSVNPCFSPGDRCFSPDDPCFRRDDRCGSSLDPSFPDGDRDGSSGGKDVGSQKTHGPPRATCFPRRDRCGWSCDLHGLPHDRCFRSGRPSPAWHGRRRSGAVTGLAAVCLASHGVARFRFAASGLRCCAGVSLSRWRERPARSDG